MNEYLADVQSTEHEELLCQLALFHTPHIGNVLTRQLIAHCGSARNVFREHRKNLIKIPGIGPALAEVLSNTIKWRKQAERTLQDLERDGLRFLFFTHLEFPKKLVQFDSLPVGIFVKGPCDLQSGRMVAVVGTRLPDRHGKAFCRSLLEALAPHGIKTISGLAYGIDAAVHEYSLEYQLETIAVLGSGINRIYPADHRALSRRIAEQGALISQFPINKPAEKVFFPIRNNVIAALCDVLVVVQSATKGGAMITANIANEFNRDVMAVPGFPGKPKHEGCNLLIKNHKAALIESASDLLNLMSWNDQQQIVQPKLFKELNEMQRAYVHFIRENEVVGIDDLIRHFKQPVSQISAVMLELECEGVVKNTPGSRYVLVC